MTIEQYYVQQDDGTNEYGPFTYLNAKIEAQKTNGMLICFEFEYSDSYIVDDFRESSIAQRNQA